MKLAMTATASSEKLVVGESEMQTRRDLAACYRLAALFGWDDLLATHISANLATEGAFLINPLGLMFDEITASSLVKVDLDGEILGDSTASINRAGFVIHSAIHAARHDVGCVIHLHSRDGVAVSCLEEGLLPLNQSAMLISNSIGYHDYEGVAVDESERSRLVADLGDKHLMLLRNHGTLAIGRTVAEAFMKAYWLEWACTVQVRVLGMGRPIHAADSRVIAKTGSEFGVSNQNGAASYADQLLWPALLRKLDRVDPGFRN